MSSSSAGVSRAGGTGPLSASPIRAQLRQATAALHEEIEQELDLTGLSTERYRPLLETFYGFHLPVEARLADATPPPDFGWPRRAVLLERDLCALGATGDALAQLPRCTELPALESSEARAGCLYVLEGACLGGQIIARDLRQRLGIGPETGGAFFAGEGAGTAARWSQVIRWIEGLERDGARREEMVASARATFGALLRWSREQRAARG